MNKQIEALKLAEEALHNTKNALLFVAGNSNKPMCVDAINDAGKALAAIREALAEPEITTPDVCGEVCARAKLCYGCGKALDEANAEPVKQESKKWVDLTNEEYEMLCQGNAPMNIRVRTVAMALKHKNQGD